LVARLLWEQDVVGSNPIVPILQLCLILDVMENSKKHSGVETQGTAMRTKKVAVNPIDKLLIEQYRAYLDKPETRNAATDALSMVEHLK
jgi:hypothetical protein